MRAPDQVSTSSLKLLNLSDHPPRPHGIGLAANESKSKTPLLLPKFLASIQKKKVVFSLLQTSDIENLTAIPSRRTLRTRSCEGNWPAENAKGNRIQPKSIPTGQEILPCVLGQANNTIKMG
jgi:hypothetical protein